MHRYVIGLVVAGVMWLCGGAVARADEPAFDHWLYLPHLVQPPPVPGVRMPGPDDGGAWTAMQVWSVTDGWLGTSVGSLYRLTEEQPQWTARPSSAPITDITVGQDGVAWAVTQAGEVLQHGSAGWAVQATLGVTLEEVSAVSVAEAWVVGDGRLWRWTGGIWNEMVLPTELSVSGVAAVSASEVWATVSIWLWHWDGTSWSVFKEFSGMHITDLAAWSDGQVWVVGTDPYYPFHDPRQLDGAQLLHTWDGTQWRWGIIASSGFRVGLVPPVVNQLPGAACGLSAVHFQGFICIRPLFTSAIFGELATPLALNMVTPYDGWALTDHLYRVRIRP